jgi:hypothetical protein
MVKSPVERKRMLREAREFFSAMRKRRTGNDATATTGPSAT